MGSLQRAPLGFGDQLKLPLTELQSSIGMPAVERNQVRKDSQMLVTKDYSAVRFRE